MLIEATETRKQCSEALLKIGCCPRCALRYLGDENQDHYRKQSEEILKEFCTDEAQISQTEDEEEVVCVTCLGILQDRYCSKSFCNEIENISRKADYECTDYFVALSTPVCLLLRDHSMWIYLTEKFPLIYKSEIRDKIISIKEVWKWYNLDCLSERLGFQFDTQSQYTISLNFMHTMTTKECNFLLDVFPGVFKQRKRNKHGWDVFNRTNVSKAIKDLSESKFKSNYSCPPRVISKPCDCDPITCAHESIYIAGRYNKYSRTLSQTEWIINGQRKTESSIEEHIVGPLNKHIKAEELRFSSSGREDVDVKMLGNGRPFVIECMNAHRVLFTQNAMNQIQQEINRSTDDIAVRHLQLVSKDDTSRLKEGEIDKMKCYTAVCWSKKVISQTDLDQLAQNKDLVLHQTTPVRVLHRRPLAVRDKVVHSMEAKKLNDHHFLLKMDTQAGTYIKEFVHGDFGRTTPNLCSLLDTECDILQLDVVAVLLDWPKNTEVENMETTDT